MSGFIHLRAHSAYSLLKGAIKIPKLIALAKAQNMPALGLVDHDNLFGSLEFSEIAVKEGVQPILGVTLSLVPFGQASHGAGSARMQPDQLLLYAKDERGYANLLQLASKAYTSPALGAAPLTDYATLGEHSDGLIALTAGLQGGFGKMLLANRSSDAQALLAQLQEMFGDRLYIELNRHALPEEKLIERAQIDAALAQNIPLVGTNNIYFSDAAMVEAHDALLCVADGRYVTETDRPRMNEHHRFKTAEEMRLLFRDIPEAIENTLHIAQRCHVWAPSRSPILPGFAMHDAAGNVLSESEALTVRARAGLEARLEKLVFTENMDAAERERIAAPYRERLEFELDVIITMKFPGYFLIVSDFISWAKEQDIPVGPGRGSGAGSIVAWVLLITDLDPLRYGLLFERFLNPERVSMPDFDIDFCQDGRERVIAYVREKYGDDRVAQIITFGKLQARAVLRDVGRVLQMPYSQVDRICKLVPNNPAAPVTLQEAITQEPLLAQAMEEDENVAHLVGLALKLEGLYRHASTHAAGLVIGDRPLAELTPLYRDPKSDMLVVQYSMKWAEAAGLVKFDFLGLRTLSILKRAVEFIADSGTKIDLLKLPEGDPKTYAMMSRGDTLGVFQFESAGMREALKNLRPDAIEDLIALGALYRPGPMDNIPNYIEVKHGRARPDYLHPLLEPVLKETYGVIIYQEQVQKIAQVLSGYTLGGADLLRRAMGKKIKAEMDAQRSLFVEGAKKNGVSQAQASNIFDLVAKFAGYGFNKSHAAAYAVIAYQTAYLKANYPVEFMAASMTYESGSTDKLSQFVGEAKKFGIAVLPPDINASEVMFSVERQADKKPAIRYALAAIKNVGAGAMAAIVAERKENGAFRDLYDFANRVDASVMNRRQLEYLTMAGVFDSLHANRHQVFESLDMLMASAQNATEERSSAQVSLFGEQATQDMNRRALKPVEEWPRLEKLNHECAAVGFYLSAHPLTPYEPVLKKLGVSPSTRLNEALPDKQKLKLAGILTATKMRSSPRGRSAFLTLSDAHGQYEVAVFDEHLLNQHHAMLKNAAVLMLGVEVRHGERGQRLLVTRIESLEEASQALRAQKLTVKVEEAVDWPRLKAMLGTPGERGARVELHIRIPGGLVKLALAGHYAIATDEIMQVQSLQGVLAEAA
ncbi:MAG: DNA polymerase III subunit alpha [Alphaproteobacteria bacterium]|nr:DNA polymerase III subunit alpha [Alphaproteobacteria bacterium]